MAAQAACPPPDLMEQVRGELLQLLSAEFQALAARCVEACVHQVWTACLTSLAAAPQPPPVCNDGDVAADGAAATLQSEVLPEAIETSLAAGLQSQLVCNDSDAAAGGAAAPLQSDLPRAAKIVAEDTSGSALAEQAAAVSSKVSNAGESTSTDDSTSTEDSARPEDVVAGGASSSSALVDSAAPQEADDKQATQALAPVVSGDSTTTENNGSQVQSLLDTAQDAEVLTPAVESVKTGGAFDERHWECGERSEQESQAALGAMVSSTCSSELAHAPVEEGSADGSSAGSPACKAPVALNALEPPTAPPEAAIALVTTPRLMSLEAEPVDEVSTVVGEAACEASAAASEMSTPSPTARETRRHIGDLERLCDEEQSQREASDLNVSGELEGSRSLRADAELRRPVDALPHEDTDRVLDTKMQMSPNEVVDAPTLCDNTVEVLRQRADPDAEADADEQLTVDQELQALQQVMEALARQLTRLDTEAEFAAASADALAPVSRGSAASDCPEPGSVTLPWDCLPS